MSSDAILRTIAVVVAAGLLAAPYHRLIVEKLAQAAAAAKAHGAGLARIAAAVLIVAAAWGKIPLPQMPQTSQVVFPAVDVPSDAMKASVLPVSQALSSAAMSDRMLWAQLWTKAAIVVEGDAVTTDTVFSDTRSLRAFVVLSLDIAWRRIGGNQPGKYAGLREATEQAFVGVVGTEDVPVTGDLRKRFAELCKALAWAALPPRG